MILDLDIISLVILKIRNRFSLRKAHFQKRLSILTTTIEDLKSDIKKSLEKSNYQEIWVNYDKFNRQYYKEHNNVGKNKH